MAFKSTLKWLIRRVRKAKPHPILISSIFINKIAEKACFPNQHYRLGVNSGRTLAAENQGHETFQDKTLSDDASIQKTYRVYIFEGTNKYAEMQF